MLKAVRGRKYPRPKRFKGVFFAAYTLYNSTNFFTKSRIDCFWCVFPGAADPNQAYTDPNTQTAAPPQQTNQPAQQPGINVKSFFPMKSLAWEPFTLFVFLIGGPEQNTRSLLSPVSNTCFSWSSIWSVSYRSGTCFKRRALFQT